MNINKDLIFKNLSYETKDEILDFLAEKLTASNYVESDYANALKEREKEYPTGLSSMGESIAIPHADTCFVKKDAIAIATLKKPITFNCMDNPKEELSVRLIIVLALSKPHGQIEMLQRVVNVIQNEELRYRLVHEGNDEDFNALVNILEGKE